MKSDVEEAENPRTFPATQSLELFFALGLRLYRLPVPLLKQ